MVRSFASHSDTVSLCFPCLLFVYFSVTGQDYGKFTNRFPRASTSARELTRGLKCFQLLLKGASEEKWN